MTSFSVEFSGDDGLVISAPDEATRHAYAAALLQDGSWLEVIPGATDITVQYDPLKELPEEALARLTAMLAKPIDAASIEYAELEIPVCYAAPFAIDIKTVCDALNLTPAELVTQHTRSQYRVTMMGFTPGFAYLGSDALGFDVARLDTPRQSVPAGSIGLAANQCGLYALPGPGGWPIIGRTPLALFDTRRDNPFTLKHGMNIRFKAISEGEFQSWQTP